MPLHPNTIRALHTLADESDADCEISTYHVRLSGSGWAAHAFFSESSRAWILADYDRDPDWLRFTSEDIRRGINADDDKVVADSIDALVAGGIRTHKSPVTALRRHPWVG